MKREARAPLIFALVLLVLLAVYVGSYCAFVKPNSDVVFVETLPNSAVVRPHVIHYRLDSPWCEVAFWPLEKLDRKLRPRARDLEAQDWFS